MKGLKVTLIAPVALVAGVWSAATSAGGSKADKSPIYGLALPRTYRSWQAVTVAHEAGNLNDIRMILGNETAMRAFRENIRPFPDGTMIVRLAYRYVPSAQNNAIFGQEQSFVAGEPTNIQIEVKDSKRFRSTGGWGYAQFEQGKANPSTSLIATCFACHQRLPESRDLVFSGYSP